jgi:hypothetical protein
MTRKKTKMASVMVAITLLLGVPGCQTDSIQRVHVVCLPDLTGSVESRAEQDSFDAIGKIAAGLKRGDALAVVPIVDDAENGDEGHIFRWQVSTAREPFDDDLRRLAKDERQHLRAMLDDTLKTPYQSTDILGSLRFAEEEMAYDRPGTRKAIVILSDFLENNARYDFDTDKRLGSEASATEFASSLAHGSKRFEGISVYLGSVASNDLRKLPPSRREAIRAFWIAYFADQGAAVEWSSDGPGRMPGFLNRLRKRKASRGN